MLNMVCQDLQEEPVLQEITGEMLATGTNTESLRCSATCSRAWLLGGASLCIF